MNEKLLNIAKEVGFDISLGEITILHMNRHINVTSQVKRLIELVLASAMPAEKDSEPVGEVMYVDARHIPGGVWYEGPVPSIDTKIFFIPQSSDAATL